MNFDQNASSFLLLKLPQRAKNLVFGIYDIVEFFSFSLCSKATKKLTKECNRTTDKITVTITWQPTIKIESRGCVPLKLIYPRSREEERNFRNGTIYLPLSGVFYAGTTDHFAAGTVIINIQGFGFRDYLRHSMDIFIHRKVDSLEIFGYSDNYPVENIRDTFNGVSIETFSMLSAWNAGFVRKIVEMFPNIEEYRLHQNPFIGNKRLSLLIQNLDTLHIIYGENLGLNDLLVIHSKMTTISFSHFTFRNMNIILKLWMKGWNSSMQYFLVVLDRSIREFNKDLLFRGCPHTFVSRRTEENGRDVYEKFHVTNCESKNAEVEVKGRRFGREWVFSINVNRD